MPSKKEEKHGRIYYFFGGVQFILIILFFVLYLIVTSAMYIPLTIMISPIFSGFTTLYVRIFAVLLSKVVGLQAELTGLSHLKNAPRAVVVMNHQSMWDLLIMLLVYHHLGEVHTVSRKEVFYMWPLGYAMWKSGSIFIDRHSPNGALQELVDLGSKIFQTSNREVKIVIFPEGTRNKKRGNFLPFRRGAFTLAMAAGVPILPIVCEPQTFTKQFQFFKRTKLTLTCLDPVKLNPDAELQPQIEEIRSSMFLEYKKSMDKMGISTDD